MKLHKPENIRFLTWLPYLVFFSAVFIYFGFVGDYVLFSQEKTALFIFSIDFLNENLHQPGALLIWSAKLLTTFFYYPVAGAIIISAILSLIVFIISKITELLSGQKFIIFSFIAGSALFYLQADYRFMMFNNLGLLLQLLLFYSSTRYFNNAKSWIPIALFPLWYYVTGGFSWIFAIMLIFRFALYKENNRWIKTAALILLSGLAFLISEELLFFQPEKTLIQFPFTARETGSQQIIFLPVAFMLASLPLIAKIKLRLPGKTVIHEFAGSVTAILVTGIMLAVIVIYRFDKKNDQYFYVEKLFYRNDFDKIIAYNLAHPPTNQLTIFLNNIALCERDRLNDLLFTFPQRADGKTLFLNWEMAGEVLKRGGYFYYTIGMINEAHRWAFENMVMKGFSPEVLKMLIRTDLISGNYETASRYISILRKTIFYRQDAIRFEKMLNNDNAIAADPELGAKRKIRTVRDFFSITDNPYINIEAITASDSLNKNAFQYKMAFMLLRKNYKGIEKGLPGFSELGYSAFPANIEEAIIAISVPNKGRLPYLGKLKLSNNSTEKWNRYLAVLRQNGNDPRSAEPALRKQFGNTFWYYAFYR